MKRNRQSDQKKQEVKDVKRVEKNALESSRGHKNRQNTARGTRRRTRKDISKKGEYLARSNARRKKIEKRSSTKRSELHRIRERRRYR